MSNTNDGGFNVTEELMKNSLERRKIADKVREFANHTDAIMQILRENITEVQ